MAGRSRTPGAEVRDQRITVRLTRSEKDRLEKVQEAEGIEYLADVPRIKALKQIRLEEAIGSKAEMLEKARQKLGLKSTEEALWALARIQLERLHSVFEKDVAE